MQVSINPNIIGKPPKHADIDLGYNWMNIESTWTEIFELITVDGLATSAELTSDNRREANFASRQLLMVDIDSGMTIPELLDNAFYNEYGAGFYATPSFTTELHKFRICFVLEQAECDPGRLRKINRGLLRVFGAADQACKDPTRLFYGTPNCVLCERSDRLLTNDIVAQLVAIVDEADSAQAESMTQYSGKNIPKLNNELKQRVLDLLKQTFVGSYPLWRNIGWGLKAGGFALQDFQYVTTGMMNQKSAADAARVWNSSSPVGKPITMGSVIHFLKERHGKDALGMYNSIREANDAVHQSLHEKYSAQMAQVKEIEKYIKELENGAGN
jgi:hypothetical protein